MPTNPLDEQLRASIASHGPITFHDWMKAALYDPEHGYYCAANRTRWGRAGDYRTSPERSVLFSATFARYFAQLQQQFESASNLKIVECGAGEGFFAAGLLKQLEQQFPELYEHVDYLIDEVSTAGTNSILERLSDSADKITFARLGELEPFEGIVFANELLDAFPVHRVVFTDGELREFYVGVDPNGDFEWRTGALSDERIRERVQNWSVPLIEKQIGEVNLAMEDWLYKVSGKLERGFLVLVDYGAEVDELVSPTRPHGSLRSFHRHELVANVLAEPGSFDITATVNWTVIRQVTESLGFRVAQFEAQDKFLLNAGLLDQLEWMTERTSGEAEKARLRIDARDMILPGGMGESFQVLVLSRGI